MTAAPLAAVRAWPFSARFALLILGLFLYGLAIRLQLDAAVGLAPWDAFHLGLAGRTGLTVGQAIIVVGVILVAAAWALLKVRPGLGSLLNMLLLGAFVDALGPYSPHPHGLFLRWIQFALGVLLLGLATGTYIASQMGAGPRDGTVLGLAARFGLPVGRARLGVELIVLLAGFLLGGQVGLGTLAFALGVGPAMSLGLGLYGLKGGKE